MKKFLLVLLLLLLHAVRCVPAWVYYMRGRLFGFNGCTIPPFGIFINEKHKDNENLLSHERIHWKQYHRLGLLGFYALYLYGYLKYGYDLHPMEIEARSVENDYCKLNYTECVRLGLSKTITDDKFRT